MKNKLVVVALVCLTALCLSVPVLAQGELSLEGLAEQLQALTDKVTALTERTDSITERMDSIEALWVNSEPAILLDDSCVIGAGGEMQDSSVLSYKETFDEWPDTGSFTVQGVNYNPETGLIGIQYGGIFSNNAIVEFWQGCEYIDSTDWWEGSFGDKAFEGYTPPSDGGE